jgi:hypothetical protein
MEKISMSTNDHKVCVLCHDTGVVWDGGASFPCHACKPQQPVLSQVEAVIYGTTYALELDRRLHEVWSKCAAMNSRDLEIAENQAIQHAISAAAGAVMRFHSGGEEAHEIWKGHETDRLYDAALKQR